MAAIVTASPVIQPLSVNGRVGDAADDKQTDSIIPRG
jgi:hypothetical protein